jgi:hypothetical protein
MQRLKDILSYQTANYGSPEFGSAGLEDPVDVGKCEIA